jgi:hypothetical protein
MAGREIHLEWLIGKPVRGITGDVVGRIEEARAERLGDEWVVPEFFLGPGAAVARLSAGRFRHLLAPIFGDRAAPHGYRVRWDQLDLSDPARPRLLCRRDELAPLPPAEESDEA